MRWPRSAVAAAGMVLLAACASPPSDVTEAALPSATAVSPSPAPTVEPSPRVTPRTTPEPSPTPVTAPATASADPSPRAARVRRAEREAPAPPSALVLPTIEISADVVPVDAGDDGVLDVPPDPRVVGWWSGGARPGQGRGAVVLDVHLDSRTYGKGPFARATDLIVGDPITVIDEADRKLHYTVESVETYEKTRLPYETLFAQDGPERVVLVTCGGVYRPDQGGWDSNVVVTFVPG